MAMTNAERQAAWRARREAELAAARKAGADPVESLRQAAHTQSIPERCATLREVIGALDLDYECEARLTGLAAEGKKNAATFSPVAIATLSLELSRLLGFAEIPDHLRDEFKPSPEAKKRAKKAPRPALRNTSAAARMGE
jgi:hypothetical protein